MTSGFTRDFSVHGIFHFSQNTLDSRAHQLDDTYMIVMMELHLASKYTQKTNLDSLYKIDERERHYVK